MTPLEILNNRCVYCEEYEKCQLPCADVLNILFAKYKASPHTAHQMMQEARFMKLIRSETE